MENPTLFETLMYEVRAITDKEKAAILNRFFKLWKKYPSLRLGQLIGNVVHNNDQLYNIEDYELIKRLEEEYEKLEKV